MEKIGPTTCVTSTMRCRTCNQSIGHHIRSGSYTTAVTFPVHQQQPPAFSEQEFVNPVREQFGQTAAEPTYVVSPDQSDESDDDDEELESELDPPPMRTDNVGNVHGNPTCFLCRDRFLMNGHANSLFGMSELPYKKHVSYKDFMGTEDDCCGWQVEPQVPPSCDECGRVARVVHNRMSSKEKEDAKKWWQQHRGLKFYECTQNTYRSGYRKGGGKRSRGAPLTFNCNRRVCSICVRKGYNTRAKSRFHHNDPEWRTSLLGCFASPRILVNTVACYYCCEHRSSMMEGNLDQFSLYGLQHHLLKTPAQTAIAFGCFPFFLFFFAMLFPADLLGITIPRMKYHEIELRTRFGVAEHSCLEWIFCKQCIYMRLLREAEARGYPQPAFWTSFEDIPDMIAKHPPHPSVGAPAQQAIY